MSEVEHKYDVAISFLVEDVALAQALYDKLSAGLRAFFFPRNQEELAGTNGMESMRAPFLIESRINLVLYKDKWGNTPWTRVETTAIQEACLSRGWDSLFFFMVDSVSTPPKWLPRTHVRLNYGEYTIDEAVGAVKLRVQELGGHYVPLTPLKQAERHRAEEEYREARRSIQRHPGVGAVQTEVKTLLQAVKAQCDEITTSGHFTIACELDLNRQPLQMGCVLTDGDVTLTVWWSQSSHGTLHESSLTIRDFNQRLRLPSDIGGYFLRREPDVLRTAIYKPDLSLPRQLGWSLQRSDDFLSTDKLAEDVLMCFLHLAERRRSGKLRAPAY
jgi:hypothetical protein